MALGKLVSFIESDFVRINSISFLTEAGLANNKPLLLGLEDILVWRSPHRGSKSSWLRGKIDAGRNPHFLPRRLVNPHCPCYLTEHAMLSPSGTSLSAR